MLIDVKVFEEKMKKTVSVFESELNTIRAGRANASILDKIRVDYFGSPMAVNQVAEVKVTDARTLIIQPWDASTLKPIEKAILASDLGITPQNDGKILRIVFPQPTEERRKELTKQIAKMGEEAKIALRNIRREANDKCKDMKKKSEMTEDEQKISEKNIQDLTERYIKDIDAHVAKKDKEVMEI